MKDIRLWGINFLYIISLFLLSVYLIKTNQEGFGYSNRITLLGVLAGGSIAFWASLHLLKTREQGVTFFGLVIVYLLWQGIYYPAWSLWGFGDTSMWIFPRSIGLILFAMILVGTLFYCFKSLKKRLLLFSLSILFIAFFVLHTSDPFFVSSLLGAIAAGLIYDKTTNSLNADRFFSSFFVTTFSTLIFTLSQWNDALLVTNNSIVIAGALFALLGAALPMTIGIKALSSVIMNSSKKIFFTRSANNELRLRCAAFWEKKTSSFISVFLILLLSLVIIELPIREWNASNFLRWATFQQLVAVASLGVLLCCYYWLRVAFSRLVSLLITLLIASLLSAINYLKMINLGEPFIPSDLVMIDQSFDTFVFVAGKIIAVLVYGGVAVFCLTLLYLAFKKPKSILNTSVLNVFRGGVALGVFLIAYSHMDYLNKKGIILGAWQAKNSLEIYKRAGFIPGFLYRQKAFELSPPQGFSATSVSEIQQSVGIQTPVVYQVDSVSDVRPHVIVIQSEAYWDPALMHPELFVGESPGDLGVVCKRVEFYCHHGYTEVPSFGAKTANTEFEFLTGLSLTAFPKGAVPFVHYIHKPTPSLAWHFYQHGYKTIGMHPNPGYFWNRMKVYPRFGFEKFDDLARFEQTDENHRYPSDRELTRVILKEMDNAQKPTFLFAVSMANHGPFNDNRFKDIDEISINPKIRETLRSDELRIIETFSTGMKEARDSLEQVISAYAHKDADPVIVVMFGDHLPILGSDHSLYHKLGFKDPQKGIWESRFFQTPFLVWSNRPLARELPDNLTVNLLGQRTLELAGLPKTGLSDLLEKLQTGTRLRKPEVAMGDNESIQERPQLQNESRLYDHVIYDAMFKQHALDFLGLKALEFSE